jgi:uncharacterized protein (TIGR02001 family)
VVVLLKKFAVLGFALVTICASGSAIAQGTPDPATPPATEPEAWKAPFGGTFTAGFGFFNDYSYRGISQTQLQVAAQASVGYETGAFSENVPLSAYIGGWGSNVYFPNTGTIAEIDLLAGFKLKTLQEKLTFDLGYIRYNYLGAPSNLFYDFNEFGLVAGYDFGVAQLSGALRYSPNFYANSGIAWYKWAQVTVPMPFIKVNENVAFKAYANIGNQYIERFANYGIPADNYWDWQIGLVVSVYGFDLSAAYTDTNIDIAGCANTLNCQGRVIFGISKAF